MWPGAGGTTTAAAISFQPPTDQADFTADGSWALFRLLDRAQATPGGGPESFRLDFPAGSGKASFTLKAAAARNPIGRNLLEGFRCPEIR